MTAQRQERYGRHGRAGLIALLTVLPAGLGAPTAQFAALATTTERVVVDRYSGLAIGGYDPVAYFADAQPKLGAREFEAALGGAVWQFRNAANRAAFVAHPEIYAPQFGGYDPVDVGRGVAFAGNPRIWLLVGQRLYLFGHETNRAAFAAEPARLLGAARRRWPALQAGLAQ